MNSIYLLLILLMSFTNLSAQERDSSFKEPVFNINFGAEGEPVGVRFLGISDYRRTVSSCPDDGNYSFITHTKSCFKGDWITLSKDRTGNPGGRMMLVNASPFGGVFFNTVSGYFQPNTTYECAVWMLNVCAANGSCTPLLPDIRITVNTRIGLLIKSYHTGPLPQNEAGVWKRYSFQFTTPDYGFEMILLMEDLTKGSCGNDFALNDITIRERVRQ